MYAISCPLKFYQVTMQLIEIKKKNNESSNGDIEQLVVIPDNELKQWI